MGKMVMAMLAMTSPAVAMGMGGTEEVEVRRAWKRRDGVRDLDHRIR